MTMNLYKPVLAGALLILSPGVSAFAQNYPQQAYQDRGYDQGQTLDNLVAPIALYPDALLSQVLVAATYPQQLAEASQWLAQTGNLPGQQRLEAAQEQNWDPSVQALVAFPDVLQRLTQDPRWTADLGNAFLNDQAGVMNAVQDLRARAQQSGRLQSTPQQIVSVDNYNGQRAIEIAPANPEVVYVPTYDPAYIWGPPAYGYYPSLYYPSVGFGFGGGISIGAFFGGYRGGFGNWGWGPSWHNRTVIVNNDFFYRNRFNGYRDGGYSRGWNVWQHQGNRGSAFSSAYSGRQNYGGSSYNRQPVQPSYNNSYRQQGFRSGQTVNPQYQAPTDRYTRQLGNQAPQQQYNRQQFSQPLTSQPRTFQQAPQQQYSRPQYSQPQVQQQNVQPRSFQQSPQQQYSRPQYSQPQNMQPRSFQQVAPQQQYSRPQYSQPRSFQQAPQQQYSRPQQSSQPQGQSQRFEQHGSGRNDAGHGERHNR